MAGQSCEFAHGGVLPKVYLILRVPVRAHKLVRVLAEQQVAHLASCVQRTYLLQLQGVPAFDRPILRAAARCQQSMLVGRPRNRLDCSLVLTESCKRLITTLCAPDKELVVVATRRELLIIVRPLQTTDFLTMSKQSGLEVAVSSQVPVEDAFISASSTQKVGVPGDCADAAVMTMECLDDLALVRVPDLQLPKVSSDCKQVSLLGPLDACHGVSRTNVVEFRHLAACRRPQVNAGSESDCELVLRRPVDEIQVKVILQSRRIKHFERRLRDVALLGVGRSKKLLFIKARESRHFEGW